jgi:hypothetical protein
VKILGKWHVDVAARGNTGPMPRPDFPAVHGATRCYPSPLRALSVACRLDLRSLGHSMV